MFIAKIVKIVNGLIIYPTCKLINKYCKLNILLLFPSVQICNFHGYTNFYHFLKTLCNTSLVYRWSDNIYITKLQLGRVCLLGTDFH